jgi:hypothetical protein
VCCPAGGLLAWKQASHCISQRSLTLPRPRPPSRPRPELRLALQSIHTNPAAALAAVPVAAPSVVYRPIGPGGVQVTEQEQKVGGWGRRVCGLGGV